MSQRQSIIFKLRGYIWVTLTRQALEVFIEYLKEILWFNWLRSNREFYLGVFIHNYGKIDA